MWSWDKLPAARNRTTLWPDVSGTMLPTSYCGMSAVSGTVASRVRRHLCQLDSLLVCAMSPRLVVAALVWVCLSPLACASPTAPSLLLLANVVDPDDVNAVSAFNSCQGHRYPQPDARNSAKNYFWPNSTNFSSTTLLKEFAACDGRVDQSAQDKSSDQIDRGRTVHLYCEGSTTRLKYFHVNFDPRILGQQVKAGAFIGYASTLGTGQTRSTSWLYSSNFDIAVSEGNDENTVDYFGKLSATALSAWRARGLTSAMQTTRAGNISCSGYNAIFTAPDVIIFTPTR